MTAKARTTKTHVVVDAPPLLLVSAGAATGADLELVVDAVALESLLSALIGVLGVVADLDDFFLSDFFLSRQTLASMPLEAS